MREIERKDRHCAGGIGVSAAGGRVGVRSVAGMADMAGNLSR